MKKVLIIMTALVVLTFIPAIVYGVGRQHTLHFEEGHMTATAAADRETILPGVMIGPVDVSDLTEEEARAKVEGFVEAMKGQYLTINVGDSQETVSVRSLGFSWTNPNAPEEAVRLGRSGNIIDRYMEISDVEREKSVIPLKRSVDENAVHEYIESLAEKYDKEAVNAGLELREDGTFSASMPQSGLKINESSTYMNIFNYLTEKWEGEVPLCKCDVEHLEAKGSKEELLKVRDILGEGQTDFSSSSASRQKNVRNGTEKINGHLIYPGDTFSVLNALIPFTEENGYDPALSFSNGRTEETFGGGICQVSTTLYLAVLRAELEVIERYNHSMTINYVPAAMDAAIAEGAKDFVFRNNLDYPIYIDARTVNGQCRMRIYGVETRDPNREVIFETEELARENPEGIELIADSSEYIGFLRRIQSPHQGLDTYLWKIVKINGEEVSREKVNRSYYQPGVETYRVGVRSSSDAAASAMYAAIDSGSLAAVNQVIANYG